MGPAAVLLSNEGASVLPGIVPPERDGDHFVLVRDGTAAIARTNPRHLVEWLP